MRLWSLRYKWEEVVFDPTMGQLWWELCMGLYMNDSCIDLVITMLSCQVILIICSSAATEKQCDVSHNVSSAKALCTVTTLKHHRLPTLPIQTIHASSQTLNSDAVSMDTMTNIIEKEDQCTLTEMADKRHTQPYIATVVEKTTGLSKQTSSLRTHPSTRFVHVQVAHMAHQLYHF